MSLDYIFNKYELDRSSKRMPIEIPGIGRDDLAKLFYELGFKVGIEVGTEQGKYAEILCKNNPRLHLYCVDAWATYSGYRDHVSQEKLDDFFNLTKERLSSFSCSLIRKFSIEAAKDFQDNSVDFVYIDANHEYRQVVDDISEWSKKVKKGGIVSGHDYCKRTFRRPYSCHVVEAVQGWTQAYHISPWFVVGSKEIKEGITRDRPRSWMWVKQ